MMGDEMDGVIRLNQTAWESGDSDIRSEYYSISGRISLDGLIEKMRDIAPYADPTNIMINFSTVRLTRPATAEELADRESRRSAQAERHEAWERKTLARLREKYGDA